MTRRVALLAFALTVSLAGSAAAQSGDGIYEFEVQGVPVIFKPIAANEVIALRMYVRGGSANLTGDTAGIERFLGSVITHGTDKYTKAEFASRVAATGTAIGGDATFDYSVLTLQAVDRFWEESWDLFTEAVLHATLPAEEVDLVREQIVNQLKGRLDNPDAYLAIMANNLLYAGHPYATDPQGTIESIEGMTRDRLIDWRAERLTRENLLFVVVGNADRTDLEAKIEALVEALPETGGAAQTVSAVSPGASALDVAERDLPTNYIRGQFATPSLGDEDYAAMRVGIDILSDRLFEEIRTKRNLTYAVAAALSQRRANYGILYVTAVEPDTTVRVMFSEVERLKREPISAERLQENISVFVTQYWMGQETNMGQASTLAAFELLGGGWENAAEFVERIRAVEPADIQRVAERYIKDLHFAVLGDPSTIDEALFTSM